MRGVVLAVAAACSACLISPVIPLGSGRAPPSTPAQAQARAARDLLPVDLVVPDGKPPPTHTFHARVWADAGFRQRPHWRSYLEDIVRRVNLYLVPAFGAELEVTVQPWERGGASSLDAMLNQLENDDAGDGADWVIGFVGADQAVSADYHRLGVAELMGKHFLLRDMNDADEARALEQVFTRLGDKDKAEIYAARKRHKETLCFLHEWAHTLGHPHEPDQGRVMAPAYSHRAAMFSPDGAALIRLGVVMRQNGPGADRAAKEMRRILENAGDEWVASERDDVLAALGGAPPAARATQGAPPHASAAAADLLQHAYDLAQAGDRRGALAALDAVRASLGRGSDEWKLALGLYLPLGAPSRFDELVGPAPDAGVADLRAEALRIRRETGLAPDAARAGIPPADEPEARAAFLAAMARLQDGDTAGARKLHAAAAKRFPRALPVALLACHIAGYANDAAGARKLCAAAVARWDELPAAHFWLGQTLARANRKIAHHRRAIELDPAAEGSWAALSLLYQAGHDAAALEALRRDFQARFHRKLR